MAVTTAPKRADARRNIEAIVAAATSCSRSTLMRASAT